MPQPRLADIPGLVLRIKGGSQAEQVAAALALDQMTARGSRDDISAAIAAAGGIPALLQLMGSQPEHPSAVRAAAVLCNLAIKSPERCQAIIAAAGIAPLVSSLDSSSHAIVRVNAAGVLASVASCGGEAGKAAIAAHPAAVPAAVRRLRSSDARVLKNLTGLLYDLASSPARRRAIAAAGVIQPLVQLLGHSDSGVVAEVAGALSQLMFGSAQRIAAVADAGGIPSLVRLLATNRDALVVNAAGCTVANLLQCGPASTAAAVMEAGGIAALVRCLRRRQGFTEMTYTRAAFCLNLLSNGGAQPSRAIADAGAAHVLVAALAPPCDSEIKAAVAFALRTLMLNGQAAAVAASDPTSIADAAIEQLPSSPYFPGSTPHGRAEVAEALRLLAAARVCAAPSCGATSGLKRCAGCGSVRYCGEACMRAHWKEHRPECKRLRAAAAAAGNGAGPSTSGQA